MNLLPFLLCLNAQLVNLSIDRTAHNVLTPLNLLQNGAADMFFNDTKFSFLISFPQRKQIKFYFLTIIKTHAC